LIASNFEFASDYILENNIVLLRPLDHRDTVHLLPFSLNEPEIWQYSLFSAVGVENLESYISKALAERSKSLEYPFIIFDKRTKTFAGSTRFYDIQLQNKSLQLGYTWIGRNFQGTGLNQNAKFLLLEFAFEKMKMERVEFRADFNNKKSIAAMKSIGCVVEGVLRANLITHSGIRRDSIILSILQDEWHDHVKSNLLTKMLKVK
jgi:N-acetyltransferase